MANSIGGGGTGTGGNTSPYPDAINDGLPVDELRELWRYQLRRPPVTVDGVETSYPLYREVFGPPNAAIPNVPFGKWQVRISDEIHETAEMTALVTLQPSAPDAPALIVTGEPYSDRTINTGTVHGITFYRTSELNGQSPPNTNQGLPEWTEERALQGFADIRASFGVPGSPFEFFVSITPYIERQPARDSFGTYVVGSYAYTWIEAVPHCVVYPSFVYLGDTPPGYAFTDLHVDGALQGYRFFAFNKTECYPIDQYGNVTTGGPYAHAAVRCPCRDNPNTTLLEWAGAYTYDSAGEPPDTIQPTQTGYTKSAHYIVTECKDGEYKQDTPDPKPDPLKLKLPILAIILVLIGLLLLALAAFLLLPELVAAIGLGTAGAELAGTGTLLEAGTATVEGAAEAGSAAAELDALEAAVIRSGQAVQKVYETARNEAEAAKFFEASREAANARAALEAAQQEIQQALGRYL